MEKSFCLSILKIINKKETPDCRHDKCHGQYIMEGFLEAFCTGLTSFPSKPMGPLFLKCEEVRPAWSTLENSSCVIWFITVGMCYAITCIYYVVYFNSIECFLPP